ncbi:MAG: RNA methyltransferase [Bacteroidales bacterium]|nr:RNA methyltransferase [Bacteroidales bacterium]
MRKLLNEELNRLSLNEYKTAKKLPLVLVLDNVRSRNNIGSIFRTSDAFLVESIALCGITAMPPHKDIHKTALGATESVHWEYFKKTETVIERLREKGYKIYAVEQTEESIMLDRIAIQSGEKYAFVLGHEVRGIQQKIVDLCDLSIEIQQHGTKHSLNVSVCAGILVWEVYKKMMK